jgi:hypothetical protein
MNSDYTDIPPFSEALVAALERRFPSRCPDMNDTERQMFLYKGKVELVAFLRQVYNKKTNEDTEANKERNIICV